MSEETKQSKFQLGLYKKFSAGGTLSADEVTELFKVNPIQLRSYGIVSIINEYFTKQGIILTEAELSEIYTDIHSCHDNRKHDDKRLKAYLKKLCLKYNNILNLSSEKIDDAVQFCMQRSHDFAVGNWGGNEGKQRRFRDEVKGFFSDVWKDIKKEFKSLTWKIEFGLPLFVRINVQKIRREDSYNHPQLSYTVYDSSTGMRPNFNSNIVPWNSRPFSALGANPYSYTNQVNINHFNALSQQGAENTFGTLTIQGIYNISAPSQSYGSQPTAQIVPANSQAVSTLGANNTHAQAPLEPAKNTSKIEEQEPINTDTAVSAPELSTTNDPNQNLTLLGADPAVILNPGASLSLTGMGHEVPEVSVSEPKIELAEQPEKPGLVDKALDMGGTVIGAVATVFIGGPSQANESSGSGHEKPLSAGPYAVSARFADSSDGLRSLEVTNTRTGDVYLAWYYPQSDGSFDKNNWWYTLKPNSWGFVNSDRNRSGTYQSTHYLGEGSGDGKGIPTYASGGLPSDGGGQNYNSGGTFLAGTGSGSSNINRAPAYNSSVGTNTRDNPFAPGAEFMRPSRRRNQGPNPGAIPVSAVGANQISIAAPPTMLVEGKRPEISALDRDVQQVLEAYVSSQRALRFSSPEAQSNRSSIESVVPMRLLEAESLELDHEFLALNKIGPEASVPVSNFLSVAAQKELSAALEKVSGSNLILGSVEGLVLGLKQSLVELGTFLGEEAAHIALGQNTKTGEVLDAIGNFAKEEFNRWDLGEKTEIELFVKEIGVFINSEFKSLEKGEKTKIKQILEIGIKELKGMPAKEIGQHVGKMIGDTLLSLGALKIAKGVSAIGATAAENYTFRSPLTFSMEPGRLNSGLPLDQLKLRKPMRRKIAKEPVRPGPHERIPTTASSAIKGDGAEAVGGKTLVRAKGKLHPCKLESNQGPDHVASFYNKDGSLNKIIMAESKYNKEGKFKLAKTKHKGKQMDQEWIEKTIIKMRRSKDPAVQDTARFLIKNEDKLFYKGHVLDPNGTSRWGEATRIINKLHLTTELPRGPPNLKK